MLLHSSIFIGSYGSYGQIPKSTLPEYCFWGRSNVGKSSLINYLTNRKELARTSSTPGKTQTFNSYNINDYFLFMDLPGYGYAKVSKSKKENWYENSFEYLKKRENLLTCFLLIDSSIPPQKMDIETINRLGKNNIPFFILLTKADKAKMNERIKNIQQLKKTLLQDWNELPQMYETSVIERKGFDVVWELIQDLETEYKKD